MKSMLFYFSHTGNTRRLAEHIASTLGQFELRDMAKEGLPADIQTYDMLGFAFPTINLNLPPYVEDIFGRIENASGKNAFFIQTYSVMPGKVAKKTYRLLKEKGLRLGAYLRISMPESFPPFRKRGILNENKPDTREREALHAFLRRLGEMRRTGDRTDGLGVKLASSSFS